MKTSIISLFLVTAASLGLALPTSSVNTTGVPPELVQALNSGNITPLSPKCANAILTVATDPNFEKCFPLSVLVEFVPIVTEPMVVIENPTILEKPLTDFCAVPKCDAKVTGGALKMIQDACTADVTNPIVEGIILGLTFYSPIRDIACFKDSDFCVIKEIATVKSLPPSPVVITDVPVLDSILVAKPALICTKCTHDIVNTVFNFFKANPETLKLLAPFGVTPQLIQEGKIATMVKCGASFLDGKVCKTTD